jgi:hypothetical protein
VEAVRIQVFDMSEVIKTLERQSAWQKQRKQWSWPEKIRRAAAIRDSIVQLRRSRLRSPVKTPSIS